MELLGWVKDNLICPYVSDASKQDELYSEFKDEFYSYMNASMNEITQLRNQVVDVQGDIVYFKRVLELAVTAAARGKAQA